MNATLGRNWRSCFDLVVMCSKKPKFFQSDDPFYLMDLSKPLLRGQLIDQPEQIKADSSLTYLQGNSNLLERHLQARLNKKAPKIAYFGDHFIGDIHHCDKLPNWDAIATIEELCMAEDYHKIEASSPLKPV